MNREAEIFADALLLPPRQRAMFLEKACDGDEALRARIEVLLAAHCDLGRFLDLPLIRRGRLGPRVDPGSSR